MPPARDLAYVTAQFLLFAAFLWRGPLPELTVPGPLRALSLLVCSCGSALILLAILQLRTTLTPWPTPKPDGTLVTSGVFRISRHPIYTGVIITTLGLALFTGNGYRMIISICLLILFYFKSRYEEQLLTVHYPDYAAYKDRVRRFI